MTILNFTGFETADDFESGSGINGTASIQNGTARNGGYALRVNPTGVNSGYYPFQGLAATGGTTTFTSNTDRYVRCYFNFATAPASASEEIFRIRSVAGRGVKTFIVRLSSAAKLLAYADGSLLATGTTTLSSGTWYLLQIKRLLGSTAAWEVKINGASELSGTTNFSGSTGGVVDFGKFTNRNSQAIDVFFDDVMVSDSAYPGDGQTVILLPNANGTFQNWTIGAGSGSHFQVVDERPINGDTDYLLSDLVSGDAETEALFDATGTVSGTVNCAKALAVVKQHTAGGTFQLRMRSGSVNTDTSNFTLTSIYQTLAKLFATDPNTSAAWTAGGLDGVETGGVTQSAVLQGRMTFTAMTVDYTPSAVVTSGNFFRMF